jgi:hypothetical protein
VSLLDKARSFGDYVIVGIYNDALSNKILGPNLPILTLNERVLSLMGCKYADDVLMDAPYVLTHDMIAALKISVVLTGDVDPISREVASGMTATSSAVEGGKRYGEESSGGSGATGASASTLQRQPPQSIDDSSVTVDGPIKAANISGNDVDNYHHEKKIMVDDYHEPDPMAVPRAMGILHTVQSAHSVTGNSLHTTRCHDRRDLMKQACTINHANSSTNLCSFPVVSVVVPYCSV